MLSISETIQSIAISTSDEDKLQRFSEVSAGLSQLPSKERRKYLIPLLYENSAAIRYEAVILLDYYGETPADGKDYWQALFAMQDFQTLSLLAREDDEARQVLFRACRDKNLRLRARLLNYLHAEDCKNDLEKFLYYYARADYDALVEIYYQNENNIHFPGQYREILLVGTRENNNTPYHRRQCAETLEKITGMEEIGTALRGELLKVNKRQDRPELIINREPLTPLSRLDLLIEKLNHQPLNVQGILVQPYIHIGTITGRITYQKPALQTMPAEDRKTSLRPPEGYEKLAFDYVTIEPRLLLNYLLMDCWIGLDDIPEGDIYTAISAEDRQASKRYLNSIINGPVYQPPFRASSFLVLLIQALQNWRDDLYERFRRGEELLTLSGRLIQLEKEETNLSGKLVNRIIQGGAADLFNGALIELDDWIASRHIDSRIWFVIFDEVWLLARPDARDILRQSFLEILNSQWKKYGLLLPVQARIMEQ